MLTHAQLASATSRARRDRLQLHSEQRRSLLPVPPARARAGADHADVRARRRRDAHLLARDPEQPCSTTSGGAPDALRVRARACSRRSTPPSTAASREQPAAQARHLRLGAAASAAATSEPRRRGRSRVGGCSRAGSASPTGSCSQKVRGLFGDRLELAITGGRADRAGTSSSSSTPAACSCSRATGMTETVRRGHAQHAPSAALGTVGQPLPELEMRRRRRRRAACSRTARLRRATSRTRPPRAQTPRRTAGSPPATSAAIDDDGFVAITGRKKDLIITSSGKNITPANIENALQGEALDLPGRRRIGDSRPYLVALLTLDPDEIAASWPTRRAPRRTSAAMRRGRARPDDDPERGRRGQRPLRPDRADQALRDPSDTTSRRPTGSSRPR